MGNFLNNKKWNTLDLEFQDTTLESQFRLFEKEASSSATRLALLLSPVVYFGYSLFDYLLIGPECKHMVYARLVTISIISPFLVLAWHKPEYAGNQILLACSTFSYGLSMSAGIQLYEQDYALYFVTGLVMTNTYSVLLLSLRIKQSVFIITLLSTICFYTLINKFDSHTLQVTSFHVLFTMGLFLSWAVYRLEMARRKQFIKQKEVFSNQSKLAQSESKRANWLENTTNFLRHELRNSIRGISSSIEMFKRFNPEFSDNKYLKRSEQSIKISNRLLSNVGNAAQLESQLNNEDRYQIDLAELINDYVNVVAPSSKLNPVEFIAKNDTFLVKANSERLIQALDNLLSNAFDYATPGTTITIKLQSKNQTAILGVENQGPPLPADKTSIFDAFVSKRGANNYSPNNMGIGLYIVKVIVQSYGGQIIAKDLHNGTGARFTLTLPLVSED